MARADSVPNCIVEQNGRKRFITKIAVTTTAGISAIGATDVYGNTLPKSYALMIQPVGCDVYYELREAGATTAVTDTSGSRPGTYVQALQQEYTIPGVAGQFKPGPDTQIDLKAASGSGTVLLFWVV